MENQNLGCIFCKIISDQVPSFKIFENEKFLAFLDVSRFVEGHTLVIPKNHIEFIWDSQEIDELFSFAKLVADHYRQLGFQYVDSMTFGRKVPHAHIHLLPHNGEENDYKKALSALGAMQADSERRLKKEEGEAIVKKFSF